MQLALQEIGLLAHLYLCTVGFAGIGVFYDFWTMNGQIDELNRQSA